ncbi:MAG: VWA domain-containing protein [Terriglobia bacterium]
MIGRVAQTSVFEVCGFRSKGKAADLKDAGPRYPFFLPQGRTSSRNVAKAQRSAGQWAIALLVACVFVTGLILQPALGAQAQSKPTSKVPSVGYQNQALQGNYVYHIQRNEVLVDVRVIDRKGNPVTDLKADDFKLYEDGALQKINSFDLENIQKLETASEVNGNAPVINLATLPRTTPQSKLKQLVQNHRLIVLFFDLSSMQIDDLMRALKSAQNFIQKQMTPADLVAVVSYTSDLRVIQDFTNDRNVLSKAIKSIEIGPASSLASNGSVGTAGGTDSFGNTVVTENMGDAFTPDETEFNIFNTDEKLSALESLAEMLRSVPGRKSVIHFSSGIEQTGVDNEAQLEATTTAANRADVSFYTIDARGLMAMPVGGDASSASPSGTAIYSMDATSSEISSLHNSRETLSTLATDTGGRMFHDLNNFAPAFAYVQKENSTYYLLGYSPSDTRSDGRFRRIKVTVDRKGVKVEARPGYYAPKNFRQLTKEDKEEQLTQAMDSATPFLELPLAVEAAYFQQPGGDYYVVLAAKLPGSSIPFKQKSATRRTAFDFAWRATNPSGKVVAALRDALPVKLDARTYQEVLKGNILYEGGFVLPPGHYKLKVVAREDQTGKMGTFVEPLVLPPITKSGLELSSVVVSNEMNEANGGRPHHPITPLEMGARTVLPSVTRVFRTNQNMYIYLQSYGGKAAASPNRKTKGSALAPSFALVFFRNGVQISEAGPYPGKIMNDGTGKTFYFTEIPLQKFPPGRYWMQVNVLDPAADEARFARIPVAIMPAPRRPTFSPPKSGS